MSQGRNGRRPGGKPVLTEEVQAKELQVLKLRRAGLTYDAIAASDFHWPPGSGQITKLYPSGRGAAHKAYRAALDRAYKPDVSEARQLEDARLDDLTSAVWAKAMKGDVGAANAAIRISERRSKLWGLDHADGIAERMVQIEADKVRMMGIALYAVLDELGIVDEDRRTAVKRLFVQRLRALPAPPGDDTDGDDDGPAGALVPA